MAWHQLIVESEFCSRANAAKVGFFVNADTVAAAGTGGDVATGDAIDMIARVIIDGGEPVDSEVSFATLDAVAPTTTVTAKRLGGDRYEVRWTATDDVGGSGVATHSLLVSRDGGNRYRTVLYRTSDSTYTYQASVGEEPVFLVRSIDAAGNVEPVADGIRVPRLLPDINLGGAPRSTVTVAAPLPQAEPAADSRRETDLYRSRFWNPIADQPDESSPLCARHPPVGCRTIRDHCWRQWCIDWCIGNGGQSRWPERLHLWWCGSQ